MNLLIELFCVMDKVVIIFEVFIVILWLISINNVLIVS